MSDFFDHSSIDSNQFKQGFCKETNEQRMKTFLSEQHATNRNKDSNDKNGKRIQTHRRPFCTTKPDADLCMRVDLPLDKKAVENQDWTGLSHRAAGPPGRRAAGPSRAGGRGPLGRGPAFSKTLGTTTFAVFSFFKRELMIMYGT